MSIRLIVPLAALLTLSFILGGCTRKEDWSDPDWIAYRMSIGDERAFSEFGRLDAEQRRSIVPEIIEVYNEGLRREQVLGALISAQDPRAREAFISGLQSTNDREASLAARGLAAINDEASSTAIAQRMTTVASRDAYGPFMEALEKMPTPAAAEVVSGLLLRSAPRIGGISTVRGGCRMLGEVDSLGDEMAAALAFSLVNFIPQPFEDPIDACELAILRHGDSMVPYLAEMLAMENERVNDHLRNLEYPPVTGQVRAARVLSRRGSDAVVDVVTEWLSTDNPVPRVEMQDLSIEIQSEWYSTFGQLFELALQPLWRRGSEADIAVLRSLEDQGDDQRLNNFSQWMMLSDGAEVGFRQAVHDALNRIGGEEQISLLRDRVTSGTTRRGGANTATMLRMNALHYLGRRAEPGQMATYERLVRGQPERFAVRFQPLRAYWDVADHCGDDVSCLGGLIESQRAIRELEAVAEFIEGFEDERAREAMVGGINSSARNAAIWQLAFVHGDNDAALNELVSRLDISDLSTRLTMMDALHVAGRLPPGATDTIAGIIEDEIEVRGVSQMREARHGLRLLLALLG